MSDPKKLNNPARTVTVFGAGIAGLTAAHELVERGFKVRIVDPDIRDEVHALTYDRGVGGMARSQWGCWLGDAALAATRDDNGNVTIPRLRDSALSLLDDVLVFDATRTSPRDPDKADVIFKRIAAFLDSLEGPAFDDCRLILTLPLIDASDTGAVEDDPRFKYVLERLGEVKPAYKERIVGGVVDAGKLAIAGEVPADAPFWLLFDVAPRAILPAEHGFRFFPSFYRHLFDTMSRTPILAPLPHEISHAPVLSNLVPSEGLGFARKGRAVSFLIPRKEIKSVEVLRGYLMQILSQLEYTFSDMKRFATKLAKYMTSCSERRAGEYESTSWGDFLEQEKYSKVSRRHIEYGPQMSAALRGSQSDARTQGNITMQLLSDQMRTDGRPDSTLNGPTSPAWLDHWYDYLYHQGVSFRRGRLTGFAVDSGEVVPMVAFGESKQAEKVASDAYVIALSLPAMAMPLRDASGQPTDSLTESFRKAAGVIAHPDDDNDFARIVQFVGGNVAQLEKDLESANPASRPLEHLSGIQFYFDVELQFWRGHTQYLDSKWGLTSIAQPQFWGRRRDQRDAYRSVLSVDIGIWDRQYKGKIAWECEPDEIAVLAWEQVVAHHNDAFKQRYGKHKKLPYPIAYAIDANITFDEKLRTDATPFLVNRVSQFPLRPGKLAKANKKNGNPPTPSKEMSRYVVHADKYVLAGTYLKTYTRLTSMEGANESARHAVNALLQKLDVPCDNCAIWDPEDNEIDDLRWLKDLDRRRFADGLPHLSDVLGSDDNSCLSPLGH